MQKNCIIEIVYERKLCSENVLEERRAQLEGIPVQKGHVKIVGCEAIEDATYDSADGMSRLDERASRLVEALVGAIGKKWAYVSVNDTRRLKR
jgi:hypothetical protein